MLSLQRRIPQFLEIVTHPQSYRHFEALRPQLARRRTRQANPDDDEGRRSNLSGQRQMPWACAMIRLNEFSAASTCEGCDPRRQYTSSLASAGEVFLQSCRPSAVMTAINLPARCRLPESLQMNIRRWRPAFKGYVCQMCLESPSAQCGATVR
ncbi:hypothetical protein BDZ97DRAFT_740147 [Flammula alnicola]|nr:hypothetical protein BDZ97DRAFT_740147 [Flammula alnicola]